MHNDQDVAAYIGLDWGDRQHAVQIQAAAGGPVEQLELEQRPHVLHGWVAQLRERFGGRPVGLAIEQRRGAVIHALMQYEFLVLYPVNPKALARYREAFHPSGAKDDPTDAALLLDLLCKHRDRLRAWRPDTVTVRTLQLLCEHRRKLVNLRGGLTNRLTSLLKQYFPQALDWVGALDSRQACDFLRKWPTLAAVQRARPTTVRRFYQQYNCRRAPVIDTRLDEMATAQPLTTDPAIVDTLALAVQSYATQLRALLEAIDTFDTQIAAVFADHPDHELFASFPGAGAVCAPRLAAAFGTDRTRWEAATELQAHAGIAPVTERCITAWRVRSSSSRRFTNTRTSRSASPCGRAATTISSGAGATTITRPCVRWPSNGCGSSFAVGRTEHHTTKPRTSTRYADTGRHLSKILLDGTTQMSMPPSPILAVTR